MTEPRPRRPSTDAEATALASATRLRILRVTQLDALTNKEIAERLGKDPATTLHHVRKLVGTGFLEALPPRRGKRGAREIPYRSTRLSRELGNEGRPGVGEAMLQAYLSEIAGIAFDDLDQTTLMVQVRPEHRDELVRRIAVLLEEFAGRPPDDDGERIGVYVALYPMGNRSGHVGVTCDDDPGNDNGER